ncbi:MAG: DUF3179 domain-containing protein [Bacteroidota bacterium]
MRNYILFLFVVFGFIACEKNEAQTENEVWTIPSEEVRDGGPGKDGIPSVDDPVFTNIDNLSFLTNDDLILGLKVGEVIRAYPHPILDWHEIINDDLGARSVAITYCPLTGTGIGWDRDLPDGRTTFGVSGLLYNSNLMPYDRASDSYWSQMEGSSVNGALVNTVAETVNLVEMPVSLWRELYPDAEVVSAETGASRPYGDYPYGSYRTDENLIFPVNNSDPSRSQKERMLGVEIDGNLKVYPFEHFLGAELTLVEDSFQGEDLLVIGSREQNVQVAFSATLADGTRPTWTILQGELPLILQDEEGNKWDLFGYAVSGPRAGEQLQAPTAYIGYWFAWVAFFPELTVFE